MNNFDDPKEEVKEEPEVETTGAPEDELPVEGGPGGGQPTNPPPDKP